MAVELVARMLHDVRDLRHERRALRARMRKLAWRAEHPPLRLAVVRRFPGLAPVVNQHPPQEPPPGWSAEDPASRT